MDSVIRGNSIVREAHYHLDGVLTDPTLPRVTIRDSAGVAQVTDAIPTRISAGIYQYTYAVALDALLFVWTDEWQGVLDGQAVGPIAGYFEVLPVGAIAPVPSATYTYNLATDVGKLRLLIQDHDMTSVSTAIPPEQRSAAFTDEELQFVLDDRGGQLHRAAAMALRIWAQSKQLIIIARRIGKKELDYGQIRADLLRSAEAFDEAAAMAPADGVAEHSWTDFAMRTIITNQAQREGSV